MTSNLSEIAAGRIQPIVVEPWRVAEYRRHLILIEALRRTVDASSPEPEFMEAWLHLAKAQHTDPELVREVLSAPQVGVWAARCLFLSCPTDLCYLQELATQLTSGPSEAALCTRHYGLTLKLALDCDDPYLNMYGERDPTPDLTKWRRSLDDGWSLLSAHEQDLAAAMAATLRVLVPLPFTGRLRSATAGWAFGAIAMSLPANELECAETLVHEFRHVLLGAIINHVDLVQPDGTWTGRAPWRIDLRPAEGLLQGCFAYAGLIALWRRLRGTEYRDHAVAALAAWSEPTLAAIDELSASGELTSPGEKFVSEMRLAL